MRRHAKASSAGSKSSKVKTARRKLLALASLTLLASLALGVSLAAAIAPTVTIEDAEDVKYTTAKVKGTVDPGDHFTEYHFEAATEATLQRQRRRRLWLAGRKQGTQPVEGDFTDLKPGTTYHVRLVASNEDGQDEAVAGSTFTTNAVAAPTVTIEPVTTFTGTSAHFEGAINPNAPEAAPTSREVEAGFAVKWHFECTPECPGIEGEQTMAADNSSHAVEADATSLKPNTDYEVRLVAINAAGPVQAGPEAFKTEAVGPEAISLPVGPVTETTAVVGGWIDPNGSPTTFYVEYADNAGFSNSTSVPVSQDASAGSGQSQVPVSFQVTGLSPGAEYHYRVVATNGAGSSTSDPQSLNTLAPEASQNCPNEQFRVGLSAGLPDCRALEKVTPNEKNGGGPGGGGTVFDADHVNFSSTTMFFDDDPYFNAGTEYQGRRGSTAGA